MYMSKLEINGKHSRIRSCQTRISDGSFNIYHFLIYFSQKKQIRKRKREIFLIYLVVFRRGET